MICLENVLIIGSKESGMSAQSLYPGFQGSQTACIHDTPPSYMICSENFLRGIGRFFNEISASELVLLIVSVDDLDALLASAVPRLFIFILP